MKIYGHLVVQNGMPDLLRAIESLYTVCDEILVVDGGSTDGTLDFLKDRKEIYNLTIFKRSFDTVQNQRKFLLNKTPKNNWIVTIDQDEMISHELQKALPVLIKSIDRKTLELPRKYPFSIIVPYCTLIKDIKHYSKNDYLNIASKVFYYDRNLEWRGEFHCEPTYPGVEGKVDGKLIEDYQLCIFHFAWLHPKRMKERKKNLTKFYTPEQWNIKKKVIKLLPEEVRV